MRHHATDPPRRVVIMLVFFLTIRPPPTSTLFPYTTLFRSVRARAREWRHAAPRPDQEDRHTRRRGARLAAPARRRDRKSTRLNSSHGSISYAVFCLKKKNGGKSLEPLLVRQLHFPPLVCLS